MRLGVRLTLYLVVAIVCTMALFAYLGFRADRANFVEELSRETRGFARAVAETLEAIYGEERDLEATQEFVDRIGPPKSVHGLVVFDAFGKLIAASPSFTRNPLTGIAPGKVLESGHDEAAYEESHGAWVYYRLNPIFDPSGNVAGAFLLFRRDTEFSQNLVDRRNRIVGTTSALVLVLGVLILVFVDRNVSRPIVRLIERIRTVGRTAQMRGPGRITEDEVAVLEREFDRMNERLEAMTSRLRHTEKLALVGRLAAGLAHEIGTPLGVIGGRAENLMRHEKPEEVRRDLQIIQSQIDRIVRIVRRLLDFSKPKETVFREVDLLATIETAKEFLEHRLNEKGVTVSVSAAEPIPPVRGDPDQLQQAFINLFLNALDAIESKGVVQVRLTTFAPEARGGTGPGEQVRITFEDSGIGIALEHINYIFDPFFSTKGAGSGTGLGLFVTRDIIQAHGGSIEVVSEPHHLTRFTVTLPAASSREHAGTESYS